jgi:Spy/CpxP family protein refolding chaperone
VLRRSQYAKIEKTEEQFMKAPKTSVLLALTAGALLALTPALRAQDAKDSKEAPKSDSRPEGKRGEAMKERLDKMATDLKLTDDQKKKVADVFKSQAEKFRELRDATPEERQQKGRAMREEMDKKMKEILTKDQYEQWEKNRSQRPGGPGGPEGKKRGEKKGDN